MSLSDPSAKMSKSAPLDRSRINLEDTDEQIARKIARAVTDSERGAYHNEPEELGVTVLLTASCVAVQAFTTVAPRDPASPT